MERTQCHIHFGMRLCCPTNGFWSFAKYWFDNRTMNAAAQSHTQQQQQKWTTFPKQSNVVRWLYWNRAFYDVFLHRLPSNLLSQMWHMINIKWCRIFKSKHYNQIEWHKSVFFIFAYAIQLVRSHFFFLSFR